MAISLFNAILKVEIAKQDGLENEIGKIKKVDVDGDKIIIKTETGKFIGLINRYDILEIVPKEELNNGSI